MKNKLLNKVIKTWKNLSTGSVNRQIFGAAATVTVMNLLVKAASVIKELVVAWTFGTSNQMDAFVVASLIPRFIVNVVNVSFKQAFIPIYIRIKEKQSQEHAQKFLSGVISYAIGFSILMSILMIVCSPLYLPIVAQGFDSGKLDLTSKLLLAISPLIVLDGVLIILLSILNSNKKFALVAILPILIPTLSITLLLSFPSWGVFSLVVGLLGGTFLQIIILTILVRRKGIQLMPKLYKINSELKEMFKLYAASATASFLAISTKFVDLSMAAMLEPGSVAALRYGQQLTSLPSSIVSIGLGTVLIPFFSKMIARGDWLQVGNTFKRYLKIIFIATTPLAIFIIVFTVPIVRILLERGAFTADDTSLVAQIQALYALEIPFFVANVVVVRLITSLSLNYIIAVNSAISLVGNIIFNYIFIKWIGIAGIALSTSVVVVIHLLINIIFVTHKLNKYSKE